MKKLKRLSKENRKLQAIVFYKIRKNTPMSSKIHRYVKFKSKWHRKRLKEMQKVKKYYSLFTCAGLSKSAGDRRYRWLLWGFRRLRIAKKTWKKIKKEEEEKRWQLTITIRKETKTKEGKVYSRWTMLYCTFVCSHELSVIRYTVYVPKIDARNLFTFHFASAMAKRR